MTHRRPDEYAVLQRRTIHRKRLERTVGAYAARTRAIAGEFSVWLRDARWQIVGNGSAAHHARGVDVAVAFFSDKAAATANRAAIGDYFWRESGEWAQKEPPDGFGSLKFYGRLGEQLGFKPVVSRAGGSTAEADELRRLMRRMVANRRRGLGVTRGGART